MSVELKRPEWLRGYASNNFDWHTQNAGNKLIYWRRLGTVEGLFDMDGTDFEGRADLNLNLHVEVRTSLDPTAFRQRIAHVWAVLRHQHILMSSKAVRVRCISPSIERGHDRAFVYAPCSTVHDLLEAGYRFLDFMDDIYPDADPDDFYLHLMNTRRAIDASQALSRLIVPPFQHSTTCTFKLRLIIVAGHQVADGLTVFRWMNSLITLLNLTTAELDNLANALCTASPVKRLPPAQESLYPRIYGSPARQRWFWLITRILRHTAHPSPPSFPNPLYRPQPLQTAMVFPSTYPRLLNYSTPPRNNSYTISATLPPTSTTRLISLCRSAKISIGSGLFVLVALSMMTLHDRLHPDSSTNPRLPFVGSFPLNPRPFLSGPTTTGAEDSLMLAFSDGITLPFLPTHLPLSSRFKLLGLQAHRQLKQYQKRRRSLEEELALGTKGSKFLLPMFFLASQDRWKLRWLATHPSSSTNPEEDPQATHADSSPILSFQGSYPPALPTTLATCGISSIGDRTALISPRKYNVHSPLPENKDIAVDFRDIWSFVRPRDGEFLVGAAGFQDVDHSSTGGSGEVGGGDDGAKKGKGQMRLGFGVSFDGNAIDPMRAREWKGVLESLLEDDEDNNNSSNDKNNHKHGDTAHAGNERREAKL